MPRSPGFSRGEPEGGRPALTLRLEPGWRIADSHDALVSARERSDVAADLPPGAELVYAVPALAEAADEAQSPAERELARTVLLILPAGGDAKRLLSRVERWRGVERAWISPRPSLP